MEALQKYDGEIKRLHHTLIAGFDDLALLIHEARVIDLGLDLAPRLRVLGDAAQPPHLTPSQRGFESQGIAPTFPPGLLSTPYVEMVGRKRRFSDVEQCAEARERQSVVQIPHKEEIEFNWELFFLEPDFKLRRHSHVRELWDEWVQGTPARPSVLWLDKRFGRRAWAGAAGDVDEASMRSALIREIRYWVEERMQPLEKVLDVAQNTANELGGLDCLLRALRRRKRKAGCFLPMELGVL